MKYCHHAVIVQRDLTSQIKTKFKVKKKKFDLIDQSRPCRNVSLCQQLSCWGLHSPARSYSICKAHRLNIFYLAVNNSIALPLPNYFLPKQRFTRSFSNDSCIQANCNHDYYSYSFFLRTIRDWNSLPSRALVLIKIFHFLKITVSQLLEMIDRYFIFYFYFYLIFTLLLYFWYCNLFNLYWVDAKELSVNICRCRCNKVTPGFEPFTGKRNAINT